ncbi:MAG: Elongation factor Ts [Chlamydiae bacterium]|nr:Elongation factor Ts [Chlamydiota bacterium]
MSVSSAMIKELRERTGVGVSKCKEALEKSAGNMDEAISFLRKAGMATAVKKSGREAKEGKIAFKETDNCVAIVEVSSETDFVASNDRFVEFLNNMVEEVAQTQPASLEDFMKQKFSKDSSMTIEECQGTLVQAIGENIQVKRFVTFAKKPGKTLGVYSHMGGKIITLVEMEGDSVDVAKDVAMHAAAASPDFLSPEKVPQNVIDHERDIARGQLAGKPEHIMDKILEGKINAFYDDVCLLRQKFVKDDSMTVGAFVDQKGKEAGKTFVVTDFIRWSIGE